MEQPQNVFIHPVTQVATASGSLNRSGRSSVTVQVLPVGLRGANLNLESIPVYGQC